MTATGARPALRRLDQSGMDAVLRLLGASGEAGPAEGGDGTPGRRLSEAALAHQFLLDALDRGEHGRFVVWPGDDPVALLYAGPTGTLVPAGAPEAAGPLAEAAEKLGWRVLVGDAGIGWALLDAVPRGIFRRRTTAREQRFMAAHAADVEVSRPDDPGLRLAHPGELDVLVDFACRLHVEDKMGPPIARSARSAVRSRMLESVTRGATYVVERGGRPVGKADVSLRSPSRGAQIAGVYVAAEARGRGVAGALVGGIVRRLVRDGAPAVSLHVRADNDRAIAAYRTAGMADRGAWVLALR